MKIYISSPRQHGMARAQVGELVPYEKTTNWLCTTPEDAERILQYLKD